MIYGGKRLHGTIGINREGEVDFHPHSRIYADKLPEKTLKLPHGRLTLNALRARYTFCIKAGESILPAITLQGEAIEAGIYMNREWDENYNKDMNRATTEGWPYGVRV